MSPQDVVNIADTVAEEFTKESADEGDFLEYSVGRIEGGLRIRYRHKLIKKH